MPTPKVVLITRDSLLAVGLKHILQNLFDIEASIYPTVRSFTNGETTNVDLFIADTKEFAANPGFYMPRRSKLMVIADTDSFDDNTGYMLNRHADESAMISRLTEIIELTKDTLNTGNELSQREIDVLREVASGHTNKEIADNLNISINTVLTHRKNITSKLGIKSVSGLSVYAMMNGYI